EPPRIDERRLLVTVRGEGLAVRNPAMLPDPFAVFPVAPGVKMPDRHAASAVEDEGNEEDGEGSRDGPLAIGKGRSGSGLDRDGARVSEIHDLAPFRTNPAAFPHLSGSPDRGPRPAAAAPPAESSR